MSLEIRSGAAPTSTLLPSAIALFPTTSARNVCFRLHAPQIGAEER
jgi:hypothetical protein